MARRDLTQLRFQQLAAKEDYTDDEVAEMMHAGHVVECAACGELSAYNWSLANAYPGGDHDQEPEKGLVAHVGASSCWEFQCGHCRAHNVERDSPLTAEVFTHVPRD